MVFVKANAEGADSLTAASFNVKGYPTFVLIDDKGEEIDRIVGYLQADEFLQTVDDYKNGIGTLADLLVKAESSTDRAMFFKIADKYKYRGGSDDAKTWYQKVIDSGEQTDSLSGESRVALADMVLRDKDYETALADFNAIGKDFAGTSFGESSILYTAYIYRAKINDTTKSISEYERFVELYPESDDVEYAQKKIIELKGETEKE